MGESWQVSLFLAICLGLLLTQCQAANTAHLDSTRLKIEVTSNSMIRLTVAELQSAGFTIQQLDPDHLYLSSGGTAVPYTILDNTLIFYGQAPTGQAPTDRYTPTRVYLLEAGKRGMLMPQTAVSPIPDHPAVPTILQTQHLEQNELYESRARTPTHDSTWFWHKIQPDGTFTIDLTLANAADGSGQITFNLWGLSSNPNISPDHDLNVLINGQPFTTLRWDGTAPLTQTVTIPAGLLHQGSNQITFNNPPAENLVDLMLLDWMDLMYHASPALTGQPFSINTQAGNVQVADMAQRPFLFDVTQPNHPERLTNQLYQDKTLTFKASENRKYLITTGSEMQHPANLSLMRNRSWLEAVSGADFVIITTDGLKTAVSPLKQQRAAAGLQTAVVSIADIYDTFSFGQATPQAMQTFLAYTARQWSPPPRYALLVGDATTDFHGYLHPPPVHQIPSPLVPVTFGGETVSDALTADVDNDGIPDLALGRWPVNSAQDVTRLVNRTLAYERQTAVFPTTLIIDHTDPTFTQLADQWQTTAKPPFMLVTNSGHLDASSPFGTEPGWFAAYIGHGSLTQWGNSGFLQQDHLPQTMPPILLQFTCLTGLFAHPTQPALSETMLHAPHGPVLLVAATSLTLSQHQAPFAAALLEQMGNTAVPRIGDAFLHAQQSLDAQSHPELQEIRSTFVLLGDPTAPIIRPAP